MFHTENYITLQNIPNRLLHDPKMDTNIDMDSNDNTTATALRHPSPSAPTQTQTPSSSLSARRRKRVSRACDRCRSKKDRCDGSRPTCLACQTSGTVCSYDPSAKKRGLPEGYVRGLEKLWALSMANIEGLEGRVLTLLGTADSESVNSIGSGSEEARRQKVLSLWADDNLHELWKTSEVFGEVEKLLNSAEAGAGDGSSSGGLELDTPGLSLGQGQGQDQWSFRIGDDLPGLDDSEMSSFPDLLPGPNRKRMRVDGLETGMQRLDFPPDGPQMLEMYFAYTHTWFPVLAKHAVLRTSYLYANNPITLSRTTPGSGDHAVLWAVMSYITGHIKIGAQAHQQSGCPARAMEFYTRARNLIPTEKERFELGHVQALLLLTLVNIGLGDWSAAWLLSGQATNLAMSLQCDPSSVASACPPSQSNALVLGCFAVDTILAVRLKRSPHMRPEDVQVPFLEEDGLEEWSAWVDLTFPSNGEDHPSRKASVARGPSLSRSFFNRLVELSMLLNKITRQDPFASGTAAFCQSTLKDMQAWCAKLPPICRLGDIGLQAMQKVPPFLLPHQTYVCLTHIATISLLYTRFSSHLQCPSSTLEKSLQLATVIIAAHARNFGQIVLPPVFEFALRTVVDGARVASVSKTRPEEQAQLKLWVRCVGSHATKVGSIWPVMRPLLQEMNGGPNVTPPWPTPGQIPPVDSRSAGGDVSWPAELDSLNSFQLPLIDDQAILQDNNQNGSILDVLGLDLGITPSDVNTNPNPPDGIQSLDFLFHNAHWPSVETPASHPDQNPGIPATTARPAPGQDNPSPRTAEIVTGTGTIHPPSTQPATPDSMPTEFSVLQDLTKTDANTHNNPNPNPAQHQQQNRLKRPAPNDIEAIFDDIDMDGGGATNNNAENESHSIMMGSSPRRASGSGSGSRSGSHSDAKDMFGRGTEAGTGADEKSEDGTSTRLMSPPSIGDIWPPPGFFPDDGDGQGQGQGQGERQGGESGVRHGNMLRGDIGVNPMGIEVS